MATPAPNSSSGVGSTAAPSAVIPDAVKSRPSAELPLLARTAMERALGNLERLQADRGSWPGDYGGPMFLLPMYIALCHAAGKMPDRQRQERITTYFFNVQRADGSVGLHAESTQGSMFCTTLSYVALRLLDVPATDSRLLRMREWIHDNGSPLGAAAWGKFTLCLLGLYDWEGIHPIAPELWLLPMSAPMHPGRLWCHCRQVYLPMAWLYGKRSTVPLTPIIAALREELYQGRYDSIEWRKQRDAVKGADNYRPMTPGLKAVNLALAKAEDLPFKPLRARSLDECLKQIRFEDFVTNDIDIGPVNKVLNVFVHLFRGSAGAEDFRRGFARCDDYLWDGHDGMKFQGYNNSELWDTAFAVQAVLKTPFAAEPRWQGLLEKAHTFIRDNQILEDVPDPEGHYRHKSQGGWPFSNREHGWPITDCTAEGFKCAVALEGRFAPAIPVSLLKDSVRLTLSWQNDDGGWATYEKKRGGAWLEALNPSQVFGDIMVDYSYVECTSASLQALADAKRRFPDESRAAIDAAMKRGEGFIRSQQRADGSFEGSWAVCFTYGTWFGVSGLKACGALSSDSALTRAVGYLLGKQRADGSWGEAGDTCRERRWVEASEGQVAQTSWALMALLRAGCRDVDALDRAARFLISKQLEDGSWAREPLVGVFNRTCLINYDNYRHYFPLWALAEWYQQRAELAARG